ncbi:hypothetical protein [Legionella feeleii]|uniref:Uncharacterized protein n=1 Tax=Legionella feeleii TaxID=453 RepID=A0A0W0U814_9GAMM|nr:hypothetical protein [Legionella feeleii]KTD04132.1 hypothetical protein Lfee_0220 [Legionella feeleii]SPX60758.1 Uncharacterised protein [Legionella feeleii]
MSNNKISPRIAAGFFGAHYHPKTAYKDLAPNAVSVSPEEEDKTNLAETKPPAVPKLREAVMKSLMEASLQPHNPLAIFTKD